MSPFTRLSVLAAVMLVPLVGQAAAAEPACEPAKLAQKYPSLVGKTVKIGADPQTPPYVMRDPKEFEKVVGFDADLAKAVLDCAGVKSEFFLGSWGGLLPATVGGQVDVFWDNLYYKPERAKQVDFALYMQAGTGGLVAAGNPKGITALDKTCGTTVAVGLGTVEVEVMNKQSAECTAAGKPAVTVLTYPDVAAGSRLVQTGRADAMLSDLALTEAFAQDNPKLYAKGFSFLSGLTIGAAVRNGDKDLLQAIYDGLKVLQADGTTKKLYAKYKIDPSMEVATEMKLD